MWFLCIFQLAMRSWAQTPPGQHQYSWTNTLEKNSRNASDSKKCLQHGAQSALQMAYGSCRALAKYAYNSPRVFVFGTSPDVEFKRSRLAMSIMKQSQNKIIVGDYQEILELYDRCPPVGLGPVLQGNLQNYVAFQWLYALFDKATASNMLPFDPISAHKKNKKCKKR